jgi:hypothetical protein
MAWTWRMEGADGSVLDAVASPAHQNQSDAESWLGEQWRELAAEGVARVTLLEDGAEVYGPMSLSAD